MFVENLITIICLILMSITLVSVITNLLGKKREDKITYIRGFKKGKGVLIYLFAIPLYWTGIVYAGETVLEGFFGAIRRTVDLVVLKYDVSPIQALMQDSQLFAITTYIAFVLVGLNAILLALSLAIQYIWSFGKNLAFRCSGKEKLYLFGNNSQNYAIYDSEKNRAKIIVDKVADKDAVGLYMKNVAYTSIVSYGDYIQKIIREALCTNKKIYAVINTGDDEKNIQISRYFINTIKDMDDRQRDKCFSLVRVFVYGDPRYEAIYDDIMADGIGCLSYVNKYQKMAIDFVDKYPFTKFMTGQHIDYDTSLVREGVDINAILIGFGKTNQQIFLTSVANNQFVTMGEDGVQLKKVKYHIFDKNTAENNKNFNHNYNRYKNECAGVSQDDYLPLPDYPAEEYYHHLDVNDVEFYNQIRNISTSSLSNINFVVIAFGSDLENIDMAQKLVAKTKEWDVHNLIIFVKVRGDHKGQGLLEEANCYFIANEYSVVYNVDNIVGDTLFRMSQLRNEVYNLEYQIKQNPNETIDEGTLNQIKEKALREWYVKKSQMERDSSIYCCLSLRSKLNIMGLDYVPIDSEGDGLTYTEYMRIYAGEDMPKIDSEMTAYGKPIVRYDLDFKPSRRKNMAIHEHLRWNSYMISKGTIPATKSQILEETTVVDGEVRYTDGKNYAVRRHGNLTTYDGLVEFRQMTARRDLVDGEDLATLEEKKDVIRYDYQILDDAYWLLTETGQKIIKTKV